MRARAPDAPPRPAVESPLRGGVRAGRWNREIRDGGRRIGASDLGRLTGASGPVVPFGRPVRASGPGSGASAKPV